MHPGWKLLFVSRPFCSEHGAIISFRSTEPGTSESNNLVFIPPARLQEWVTSRASLCACRSFSNSRGSPPHSAFWLIRGEWGQLEHGSPSARHRALPGSSADHSGARSRPSLLPFSPSWGWTDLPQLRSWASPWLLVKFGLQSQNYSCATAGGSPLPGTALHGQA